MCVFWTVCHPTMPPKSRAEIQREYRHRRNADPHRRELYLQHEQMKYRKDVSNGKRKLVSAMSEREVRRQRREWKNRQRRSRVDRQRHLQYTPPPEEHGSHNSRQKEQGRKCMRRERKAAYRRIAELETELAAAKRNADKYKKRYLRSQKKTVSHHPLPTDTPRTKTRKLLANFHRNKEAVRKTLVFHYALVDTIRKRYQDTKLERQKRTFACLLSGRIVQRYRLQSFSYQQLGFSVKRWSKLSSETTSRIFEIKRRRFSSQCRLKDDVLAFYVRDDVSRNTAGKKETVTKHKCKMQKRLLCDTLLNTHLTFLSEHPQYSVSYSMFCRMRPFWVVPARESDRQTCLCKTHENIQLIIDKLVELRVLSNVTVDHLCDATVCDAQSKNCMYGKCGVCVNRELQYFCDHNPTDDCLVCASALPKLHEFDRHVSVSYYTWKNKVDIIDGKKCSYVMKELETTELGDLVDHLHALVCKARRHVFNIRHRYMQYRKLRSKLDDTSCLIHIDFSENYLCRYHSEIQSAHFGASDKQTTLHTGVLYIGQKDSKGCTIGQLYIVYWSKGCTISDSRLHEPAAIWAFMEPVFKQLRSAFPGVVNVHMFSDGPTTQYRQRKNFFLFCTKFFEYGFQCGTWNFFEASHGKGAADGVGGVLKRTADRLVKQGADLPSAFAVFEHLVEVTNVELYFVNENVVSDAVNALNQVGDLPIIPGTMNFHQIYVNCKSPGTLLYLLMTQLTVNEQCLLQGISCTSQRLQTTNIA